MLQFPYMKNLHLATATIALTALVLTGAGCSSSTSSSPTADTTSSTSTTKPTAQTISRSDAIDEYWYQIASHVTGTQSVEAYSALSGSTYTLDADFGNGFIDTLNNGEGDVLSFTAELHEDGTAAGDDQDGNTWSFTLDMNSPLIDSAISAWAAEKGFIVE